MNAATGELDCLLTTLTPLFIGKETVGKNKQFITRANKPVIPGTSLKGLFRSMAELVGGGCMLVKNKTWEVDDSQEACTDCRSLCITCRMFGMMERQAHARVLKGKISISDGVLVHGDGRLHQAAVYLGSPKPSHTAFYKTPGSGVVDGRQRKFYFHQPGQVDALRHPTAAKEADLWTIDVLPKGHTFRFSVQFENLTDAELSLLLYVVALEERAEVHVPIGGQDDLRLTGPLRHKLGYAKSLGAGSCHVRIETMTLLPTPRSRYSSLACHGEQRWEGGELLKQIAARTTSYVGDSSPTMQALRVMLVWDEKDRRRFSYPDFHWFKHGVNSAVPLKRV
ncbi:MAG: hypothetical protein HYX75_20950 [Acidobacteria bacterium]|nr:hypothetical protein [Acidobacteriota bacterium]